MFKPWEMMAIDHAGYNGIRDEHIRDVAEELLKIGQCNIDRQTFERACGRCLIDPNCFTQEDLQRLENTLNEWGK